MPHKENSGSKSITSRFCLENGDVQTNVKSMQKYYNTKVEIFKYLPVNLPDKTGAERRTGEAFESPGPAKKKRPPNGECTDCPVAVCIRTGCIPQPEDSPTGCPFGDGSVFGRNDWGTRLHFCRRQKLRSCRHPAGGKQQSTGLLHLIFESHSPAKKKDHPMGGLSFLVETGGLEPSTSCV